MFKKMRENEEGATEVVETILLMPIFLLIMSIGMYLAFMPYARSMMLDVASRGADMVSIYGGNNGLYAPTNVANAGGVTNYIKETMNKEVRSGFVTTSGDRDWTISCSPDVVANVGEKVGCTVRYHYSPPFNVFSIQDLLGVEIPGLGKQSTVSKMSFSQVGELS